VKLEFEGANTPGEIVTLKHGWTDCPHGPCNWAGEEGWLRVLVKREGKCKRKHSTT